jgi:uncharacterized protein DUF6089
MCIRPKDAVEARHALSLQQPTQECCFLSNVDSMVAHRICRKKLLSKNKPMKAFIKSTPFIILFAADSGTIKAQLDLSRYEIGIAGSGFVYQGDLTPSRLGSYRTLKPGVQVFLSKIINPIISLRTNVSIGELKGDDSKYPVPEYRQQRNFNFKTPVFEISEVLVADLLKNNMTRQSSRVHPYLYAGVGFSFLNIKRDWSRFNAEHFSAEPSTLQGLADDVQHSLPKMIPEVPLGIGIRYSLSKRISLNAESAYRFIFTDYLDGFSQAADPSRKDSYQTHSLGIIYQVQKTNPSWKCPVPKY